MLNSIQIIFVVLFLALAFVNLMTIVNEITSGMASRNKKANKLNRVEIIDAGQEAQYFTDVNRTSNGWDFGVDIGGGCDGIGL